MRLGQLAFLISAVLLFAAITKTRQLAVTGTWSFAWLAVAWETSLAVWLLSGIRLRRSLQVATFCFVLFAAVSLWHAVRGDPSCGCFGDLSISPWLVFLLDVTLAVTLMLHVVRSANDTAQSAAFGPGRRARFILPSMAILAVAVSSMGLFADETMPASGVRQRGRHLIVSPSEWIGRPFPLFRYLESSDDHQEFHEGTWRLLIARHDCPRCLGLLHADQQLDVQTFFPVASRARVVAWMPPHPEIASRQITGASWREVRLSDRWQWVLETPWVIHLRDGVVVATEPPKDIKHAPDG